MANAIKWEDVGEVVIPGDSIGGSNMVMGRVAQSHESNIKAAFEAVHFMIQKGYWCQMRTPFNNGDGFWCGFTPHNTSGWNGTPDHWTCADNLPTAICRAFLKTMDEMEGLSDDEG